MPQCVDIRQPCGDFRCAVCGARWDADDAAPAECVTPTLMVQFERRMAARTRPVHERLTIVCDDLRNARAPERLIREIENCIIEMRTK